MDLELRVDQSSYCPLIRICRNGKEKVDWIGCFAGLDSVLVEGFACEAVVDVGGPKLQFANRNYILRLNRESIKYVIYPYFLWRRRGDPFKSDPSKIPLIARHEYQDGTMMDDPELQSVPRTILLITPVMRGNQPTMALEFRPISE